MRFSVIIPVYLSHETLPFCIEGLQRQDFRDFEVIFVDSSPDLRSAEVIKSASSFRLVRSEKRLWMFAARNLGVQHSQGAILVFTDPDCIPAADWLSRLDESFQEGHNIVGGSIACSSDEPFQQLAHFVKFWRWLPGGISGSIPDQPTANFAVARNLFESLGGFSDEFIACDTLFCSRLLQSGHEIFFNARAVVQHIHENVTLRSLLRERFRRGIDFAQMRSTLREWNTRKSVLFLATFWLLPLRHLLWKIVIAAQRGFLWSVLLLSPLILLCDYSWMAGQAATFWRQLWKLPPIKLMT